MARVFGLYSTIFNDGLLVVVVINWYIDILIHLRTLAT